MCNDYLYADQKTFLLLLISIFVFLVSSLEVMSGQQRIAENG